MTALLDATCRGCLRVKAVEEFGKDKAQKSGRRSRCKTCCAAATAAFRETHPTYKADWQKRNKDKVSVHSARYRDSHVSWHLRYPEVSQAMNQRRRAREAAAPGFATPEQIIARMEFFGLRCWMCSSPYSEVDHVKPLSKGGSNWPSNLRPICTPCNRVKGAEWPLLLRSA